MKTYNIKARVLNMGSGPLLRSASIQASGPDKAAELFYKRFLTLEILDIKEAF